MANCVCPMMMISTSTRRSWWWGSPAHAACDLSVQVMADAPATPEVPLAELVSRQQQMQRLLDKMASMVGQHFLPKMGRGCGSHGWRTGLPGEAPVRRPSPGSRGNCCSAMRS